MVINMNTIPTTLLEALDIEGLDPEEQEELMLDLHELVFKGALLRMIERMDDATKEDFDTLMVKNPSEEEIQAFLDANVPEADQAVADTLADLTNDILSVTGESQD